MIICYLELGPPRAQQLHRGVYTVNTVGEPVPLGKKYDIYIYSVIERPPCNIKTNT